MTRVQVRKELLAWASARSGLGPDELTRRFPKLAEWESGESQPTLKQLEGFACATHTPFGYLFLAEPPEEELPFPHFRTQADTPKMPSPALLATVQTMFQRQEWFRDLVIEHGQDPLPFVGSAAQEDEPEDVAHKIRETLGLEMGWANRRGTWTDAFRFLRLTAEDAGILVAANSVVGNNTRWHLDPGEFRGFVMADAYAPLIFINAADGKAAQMFTFAHELAHVWVNKSAAFDLRKMQPASHAVERFCDRVAAEFLIPRTELTTLWASLPATDPIERVARHFKVSSLVAARRVLDLGLMTRHEFFSFYDAYREDERRTREMKSGEMADFFVMQGLRIGRHFAAAVVRAAMVGDILYTDAYRLTGLYGQTFETYAKKLRVGGEL